MTWNVIAIEVDDSVSAGDGSATEDSSTSGSSTGSGTARELELGGAEYILTSRFQRKESRAVCWMESWVGQSTLKSQFQRVAGWRLRAHLWQDLSKTLPL